MRAQSRLVKTVSSTHALDDRSDVSGLNVREEMVMRVGSGVTENIVIDHRGYTKGGSDVRSRVALDAARTGSLCVILLSILQDNDSTGFATVSREIMGCSDGINFDIIIPLECHKCTANSMIG